MQEMRWDESSPCRRWQKHGRLDIDGERHRAECYNVQTFPWINHRYIRLSSPTEINWNVLPPINTSNNRNQQQAVQRRWQTWICRWHSQPFSYDAWHGRRTVIHSWNLEISDELSHNQRFSEKKICTFSPSTKISTLNNPLVHHLPAWLNFTHKKLETF